MRAHQSITASQTAMRFFKLRFANKTRLSHVVASSTPLASKCSRETTNGDNPERNGIIVLLLRFLALALPIYFGAQAILEGY